ncbi:MAG: repair ATPase [Verrucomicrobiales bacterium]|nr:repair ATPase [Verrucomicrobiales bacterium]
MLAVIAMTSGCGSTVRKGIYSAYESVGVYKRDLLKKRVVAARDDQKEAGQQFKDALTRLKEITKFEGGDLERTYTALKSDYEKSASKAETVHKRIRDVETVAQDLFAEWEKEIQQITTASLQSASRTQLSETKSRYEELHTALLRAEQTMDPVLRKFNDQVLFLKHNLNAQAIASLKGESANIQADITQLITEMNRSIAQADEFVKQMK